MFVGIPKVDIAVHVTLVTSSLTTVKVVLTSTSVLATTSVNISALILKVSFINYLPFIKL